MSQQRRVFGLAAAVGLGLSLLLSGCFLTATPPVATPATSPPAPETPPATTPPVPSATPTNGTGATNPPTATGCAANSAVMPSGAVHRKVGDIDGDKVADTEWISDTPTLRFGVTTASGATFSYPLSSASPLSREGFVTRLNYHRIVSIVDDGRGAYVHFFVNCSWIQPKDSHGVAYTYDMNDFSGHGTGVGCSGGFVVGYQATNTSTGYTVKQTKLYLNATGSYASNGPTSTVVSNASSSDPRVTRAMTISCGTVTLANSGVHFG
ncbi:MAG: hypothetical protein JWQ39_1352 [Glaciihabitans sp.]|nr:hypothetical protein [Glaciihabitans sp.]